MRSTISRFPALVHGSLRKEKTQIRWAWKPECDWDEQLCPVHGIAENYGHHGLDRLHWFTSALHFFDSGILTKIKWDYDL